MGSDRRSYLLRVWLPDRPGALGAVASRVGAVGGDIVAVDIVDRGAGQAVDDLVVQLDPDRVDLLVREIRAVDGADVEEIHPVGATPPDLGLGVLAAATAITGAPDMRALGAALAEHATRVARLEWSAVCRVDDAALVATSGEAPASAWLVAYAQGMHHAPGNGSERAEVEPADGADDPQVAFSSAGALVLLAGRSTLSIRSRERQLLASLVELAAIRWRQLSSETTDASR
jgi:hypothetical protein